MEGFKLLLALLEGAVRCRGNNKPEVRLTQHTPLKGPVGVMLGCCTAQRAVQWSLLTNQKSGFLSSSNA